MPVLPGASVTPTSFQQQRSAHFDWVEPLKQRLTVDTVAAVHRQAAWTQTSDSLRLQKHPTSAWLISGSLNSSLMIVVFDVAGTEWIRGESRIVS